jgi:hypothetical protein
MNMERANDQTQSSLDFEQAVNGPASSSSTPPAEGERRAIAGYYPQYRLSASIILQGLRDDTLQWIRIADPEAGRVDDFQLGTQARVDAYQVKWSQYGGTVSFHDLATPSGDKPSLINQLAQGWTNLRRSYSNRRVVVHLVTNQSPSVSDGPPIGEPPPSPKHFSAFVSQTWRPAHNTPSHANNAIPQE